MILKNKDNIYKISISIIFGLLGFFFNFHTIIFPFGEYTAAILFGLLFPILITLSWGWKYGLLSALVGGCQSIWWLWGPSNGYAILLVVPPFTLWVVWHGIFAELRRKQKTHKWWLSIYIVEIPFRILSSINLLTLSRWAITLNPPPWSWASNAPNTIPMHFSVFVTIKQAAVAFVILLLADILLNVSHVRIFFKLKEYIDDRKTGYIISTFLLLGCLFWLLDSAFYAFAFHKESSFLDLLALDIPNYNIFIRTIFFIFCLVCGLITSRILRRQREGETALRESEKKYRNIFENSVEGIFESSPEGRFVSVNPAFAKMLGYASPEELVSNISDIAKQYYVDPEDRHRYQQLLKKAGSVNNFEFKARRKDGSRIWVSNSTRAYFNEDDKVVRYEGLVYNISERKQAEEALQKSEKKHRLLAENTIDCIWQMNLDLEFTYINQAILPFLGYTPKEWIGSKLPEHCSSEEMEKMQAIILDVLVNLPDKTTKVFETSLYHKNGEEIPCEISGKMLLDDAGNPIYFQGTTRDITERKNAIKILQDSEKKLEQAVQGNSIPTFIIDNNHIITHWNSACESLTGFSSAEMVGTKKQWLAFYPAERPILADLIMDEATEKEIDVYYEGKHRKSVLIEGAYEGESFFPTLGEKGKWLFFTAAPLRDQGGNIIGAIQTFQDITERKSTEAQLLQAQKMEAIGTLAGGIAHDFNNLLTTIIGNAQLALMDISKDDSLRKQIEEIKKAGDRSASLTRQLLAFSRKQVIKPEVIDINNVINETEKMLKRMIGEDMEFQTILKPELWKVHMDSGQVDQILMNLAVNARDAMPQGGKLIVETANVHMNKNYFREHGIDETPGHYVMLAISDTGSGMNKETQERIFEPFFTTKEIGKGTGLGLSTVYGIAKQNNGFIWVYSEPGQGTTFKIYLPKVKEGAEAEEKERTPVGDLNGSETVLVVEDDDRLRNLARKILELYGYRVLEAENGENALRVSEEYDGQIDLLLTDVVMPKMSGRETAERLQSLRPEIKVIYMSGYTDDAIVHHGVLAPGLNFLEKPFAPEDLARKVREVLDQ